MKKNIIFSIVVFLIIGAIVLPMIKKDDKQTQEAVYNEKVYKVAVMEVGTKGNDVFLNYTGIVQPQQLEQAAFNTAGTVKEIYVEVGQKVNKGDVLAMLDDTDALRQVDNSNNNLTIAQTNLNSANRQYHMAYEDYAKACSPEDAKKNMEDAVARRDEQIEKNEQLSKEIVDLENEVSEKKTVYDNTTKSLMTAKSNTATKEAELEALKNTQASVEQISAKEAEVSSAKEAENIAKEANDAAATDYSATLAKYQSKQAEFDAGKTLLTTYNQNVDTATKSYENKLEDGSQSADAKALEERVAVADVALYNSQATYKSAKNNYDSALATLEDCKLIAQNDGYVISVEAKVGSLGSPIMPAIIIGSNENVVSFGVSQNDIRRLKEGMQAEVTINGKTYKGKVSKVSLLPDSTSRTYTTEVLLETEDVFYLGEMGTVKINAGAMDGVWLPLSIILNDGQDYVYIVENDRAKRQNIVIQEISNDYVMVSGIDKGCMVISEGMKLVRTGSLVDYK